MSAKSIEISYCLLKPFHIIYRTKTDIAFPAKEPTHTFPASLIVATARMIMIYEKLVMSTRILRARISAYPAAAVLGGSHIIEPCTINSVFVKSYLAYFLLHPFRTASRLHLGVCLEVFLPPYPVIFSSLLSMSRIRFACDSIDNLLVFTRPFGMQFCAAFLASRIAPIFTEACLTEGFEGKVKQAMSTLARGGINLFRGHIRSHKRVGFARCLQHLTPLLYQVEVVYGC